MSAKRTTRSETVQSFADASFRQKLKSKPVPELVHARVNDISRFRVYYTDGSPVISLACGIYESHFRAKNFDPKLEVGGVNSADAKKLGNVELSKLEPKR